MLLCKKIKLEVSEQDAATLEFMQGKCRGLYNWHVMRLRHGEKWPGASWAKKTLQDSKRHDPELEQVYGKLLHEVYYRLDSAMQAFFRRLAKGEKPGFPRVRPRHCFFTLCYPAMYLKIEGKTLILPTGGKGKNKQYPNVQAVLTEMPPESFREVAISRDARGNYYASFSFREQEEPQQSGKVVAFDVGIKTLAVGVNEQGKIYHVGGFKGSRGYNKQRDRIRSKRDTCKKKSFIERCLTIGDCIRSFKCSRTNASCMGKTSSFSMNAIHRKPVAVVVICKPCRCGNAHIAVPNVDSSWIETKTVRSTS